MCKRNSLGLYLAKNASNTSRFSLAWRVVVGPRTQTIEGWLGGHIDLTIDHIWAIFLPRVAQKTLHATKVFFVFMARL